jgi:hypothetical protein
MIDGSSTHAPAAASRHDPRDRMPSGVSSRDIARALVEDAPAPPVRTPPPAPPAAGSRAGLFLAAGAGLLVLIGGGAWFALSSSHPDPSPVRSVALPAATLPNVVTPDQAKPEPAASAGIVVPPPAPAGPRAITIAIGDEKQILAHVPVAGPDGVIPPMDVFRFQPANQILVLDFASLHEQGAMLNRAAAFVEKAGAPHDTLLSDADLDAMIKANGDTVETFYYGHDYGRPALSRFFAEADREALRLTPQEQSLRSLLNQEGWSDQNARGAVISIPQVGADEHVTMPARATILHHELSHGAYFTDPAYAAFVHRFWTQTLTAQERDRIRGFLRGLGYDPALEEVMENEAQAYLIFTENPEFFTPAAIGMTPARLKDLRTGFHRAMPAGWLRDSLGRDLNLTAASATPAKH